MKINLGCRNRILHGYANIDLFVPKFNWEDSIQDEETSFYKINAMDIDQHFEAGTIDEIVATHFFEHLTHEQITTLLYKLWCLLKPRGELIITTPDFYNIINSYKSKHEAGNFSDVDILHIKVFDTKEESFHKTVWYKEIGEYYLEREGLFHVEGIERPSPIEIKFIARKV